MRSWHSAGGLPWPPSLQTRSLSRATTVGGFYPWILSLGLPVRCYPLPSLLGDLSPLSRLSPEEFPNTVTVLKKPDQCVDWVDLNECHEPESVRGEGEPHAIRCQEPDSLLRRPGAQRQDDFPGPRHCVGAESKGTIRTGSPAVLVWEATKASEKIRLSGLSPTRHLGRVPGPRARSAPRSQETSRTGPRGEGGQGTGVIGELLTAVRTLKSSRLRYRSLATFTFPMAAPDPAPKPRRRLPARARHVRTPPPARARAAPPFRSLLTNGRPALTGSGK